MNRVVTTRFILRTSPAHLSGCLARIHVRRVTPSSLRYHLAMIGVIAAGLAMSALAGTARDPDAQMTRAEIGRLRCANVVQAQLDAWNARPDFGLRDPPLPEQPLSVRVPTDRIGVWIRLIVRADGAAEVVRVAGSSWQALSVAPMCRTTDAHGSTGAVPAGTLSDDELHERATLGPTVVLVWSPHLPLSVDAVAEARAAADRLGLSLLTLLDPNADGAFAARTATERGWDPSVLRSFAAIELLYRGMTTHAPSLTLVVRGGAPVVLFGYRDRTAVETFLREQLAAASASAPGTPP